MKAFYYIGFVAVTIFSIFLLSSLINKNNILHEAESADMHISNSRLYAKEKAYDRSLYHLNKAIDEMLTLEQELDTTSRHTVDAAIGELLKIKEEMESDSLVDQDMSIAFTKAMNALTFVELKVSEQFLEENDKKDAIIALKYSMIHIHHALKFVDSGHKDHEMKIYLELDSLLHHTDLPKEEIIAELNRVEQELDSMMNE